MLPKPPPPKKKGVNGQFQAKTAKYKNHNISETVNRIKTKFEDQAETGNCTSCVVKRTIAIAAVAIAASCTFAYNFYLLKQILAVQFVLQYIGWKIIPKIVAHITG